MLQAADESVELQLNLDEEFDEEELDALTTGLRRQLLQLDVESVDRAEGPPPPTGARAADASSVGMLLVTLASTPELLRALVGTVRGWLSRSVKVKLGDSELEVTGVSSEQQERLITDWVSRNAVG
jgi:hypothetical protein